MTWQRGSSGFRHGHRPAQHAVIQMFRMLNLLENPEASVDAIEDILRHDPGLTANVLKLANSAYFGIYRQGRLTAAGRYAPGAEAAGAARDRLLRQRRHGAARARLRPDGGRPVASFHRCRDRGRGPGEEQAGRRGGGRVHRGPAPRRGQDCAAGRFVQEELPDIKRITAGGVPLVLAENMVLGTDHAAIGATVLESWAFPPDVVRTVRWHHNPEAAVGPSI